VRPLLILMVCLALTLPNAGCNRLERKLNGTGSTFIAPLMKEWGNKYYESKQVKINYESVGSGAGVQRLNAGIFDFACTDAPLTDKQLERLKTTGGDVVHIPLVMDAVVPVYNLDDAKYELIFSGEVLADIFAGQIKKWNDKAIQELNPDAKDKLPDKEIVVVHRNDGSGTTYILTDYFSKVSAKTWKNAGTSIEWRTGEGKTGNDGVANHVETTPFSIGYLPLTHALKHDKLKVGLVKNREGIPMKATPESIQAAASGMLSNIPDDLRYSITDAPGKDSYPISGTTWAIVFVKQPPDKGREVVDFLRWATHEGQDEAEKLHYPRLPKELVSRVEKKLDAIKVQ
jgi:phosphate ABC transporter phosphate-binding protein